jgi:hypothetical protein
MGASNEHDRLAKRTDTENRSRTIAPAIVLARLKLRQQSSSPQSDHLADTLGSVFANSGAPDRSCENARFA